MSVVDWMRVSTLAARRRLRHMALPVKYMLLLLLWVLFTVYLFPSLFGFAGDVASIQRDPGSGTGGGINVDINPTPIVDVSVDVDDFDDIVDHKEANLPPPLDMGSVLPKPQVSNVHNNDNNNNMNNKDNNNGMKESDSNSRPVHDDNTRVSPSPKHEDSQITSKTSKDPKNKPSNINSDDHGNKDNKESATVNQTSDDKKHDQLSDDIYVGYDRFGSSFPLSTLRSLYLNIHEPGSMANFSIDRHDQKNSENQNILPSPMRVLVTGGAGFIGSHLVDRLMLMGHQVTVLDNFFTGSKSNVQHWLGNPRFDLVRRDVIEEYLQEVDRIYHLACPASPPFYQYNPVKTIKTSIMGTINMLGLAKRVKARLLFTSTSEVYGDPEEHPQKETYWGHVNPIGPRACYDEGKRVAETLVYSYLQQEDVDVRVARIFNTFGPRMNERDGRVVSNFILQALQNDPITVYGDGKQTRSFQYVHDVVDGLINLMESDYKKPVNLGNPEEFTINDFAEMIRAEVKSEKAVVHLPATEDDPKKRKPDISVARKEIGWQPRITVRQGISETIEYFRSRLEKVADKKAKDEL